MTGKKKSITKILTFLAFWLKEDEL